VKISRSTLREWLDGISYGVTHFGRNEHSGAKFNVEPLAASMAEMIIDLLTEVTEDERWQEDLRRR
jgi:hypothetical protein